jgi:hypothetical protein
MNLFASACLAALLALAACEISPLHGVPRLNISKPDLGVENSFYNVSGVAGLTTEFPKVHSAADPPVPSTLWHDAFCAGSKLHLGMTYGRDRSHIFVTPADSPWDGEMVQEMMTWGYNDETETLQGVDSCDFDVSSSIGRPLDLLGISTESSKDGGPNKCYRLVHRDGPAVIRDSDGRLPGFAGQLYEVNGRVYQVSLTFLRTVVR